MNTSRYFCCHTDKRQLVEHVRETCYGPHSVTPGGVPNTNIVRNVLRLPNSSANYWGGQSSKPIRTSHNLHTHTDNTRQSEPQLKRCHFKPQLKECHVFNPYPEPQLKRYITSHNSRNTLASRSLRYHQSLVDHKHPKQTSVLPLHYRLMLLQSRQGKSSFRPSRGSLVLLGAARPKSH